MVQSVNLRPAGRRSPFLGVYRPVNVVAGPLGDEFGIGLGSCLGQFGMSLGSVWGHFGMSLGSCWGHFGMSLGPFLGQFGMSLGSFWGNFGMCLWSCWGIFSRSTYLMKYFAPARKAAGMALGLQPPWVLWVR